MGHFAKIKGQSSTKGGAYFQPGNYVVQIQRCKMGQTRKEVDFFVAECKIVESDNDELRPGSEGSFMVTMDKDPALGNIADFMRMGIWLAAREEGKTAAELGSVDAIPLDEEDADEIVSEENPLAGLLMGLYAYNKPTRAGNDFTRHKWITPEEARENIKLAMSA